MTKEIINSPLKQMPLKRTIKASKTKREKKNKVKLKIKDMSASITMSNDAESFPSNQYYEKGAGSVSRIKN